ncbi:hypothetical protein [Cytobacillus praedii]|uniref:hypothetical protein n=1 Tax=Cytobacillus praedii TaxID=1742358 RepID=UPI002E21AFEF|nr:hypothetical protein [Cytobacillus praedii]
MLKGVFNRNNDKDDSISYKDELHKQILRIDALEVQINKLLESEKQPKVNVYGKAKQETSNQDVSIKDTGVNETDINFYKQKVNELSRRINNLEKKHREIELSQSNKMNQSTSLMEPSIDEKQIKSFIEQLVSEKLAVYHDKEQKMMRRIQTLEHLVLNLDTNETKQFRESVAKGMGQSQGLALSAAIKQLGDEKRDRAITLSLINDRVHILESNYEKLNGAQAGLIRITDELVGKHNELLKKWEVVEDSVNKSNPIYETLYIDKLYLDKYEQNNNFEQLGIKELSGALNIGATYGKDVIPKKVTEEVKSEMEKLKQVKEEMEKLKGYKGEEETEQDKEETEIQVEEFPTEFESLPSDEEEGYVDILIEDDDS